VLVTENVLLNKLQKEKETEGNYFTHTNDCFHQGNMLTLSIARTFIRKCLSLLAT
jgi:hypothetical protein